MIKKFGDKDIHPDEDGRTHYVSFHSYICDDETDVKNLPDKEVTAIGSMAFVMTTGKVYTLSSENGWIQFGNG